MQVCRNCWERGFNLKMEQRRTKSVIHNPCKLFLHSEVSNAVNHVFNTQGDTNNGCMDRGPTAVDVCLYVSVRLASVHLPGRRGAWSCG